METLTDMSFSGGLRGDFFRRFVLRAPATSLICLRRIWERIGEREKKDKFEFCEGRIEIESEVRVAII